MANDNHYNAKKQVPLESLIYITADFGVSPQSHLLTYNFTECRWKGDGADPYDMPPWEKARRPDLYDVIVHTQQTTPELVFYDRKGPLTVAIDVNGTFYTNSHQDYLAKEAEIKGEQAWKFETHEEVAQKQPEPRIDEIAIDKLKYLNPRTKGAILSPEQAKALADLTRALRQEPQPAFVHSPPDTRLTDITGLAKDGYAQNQEVWFNYFNDIIARYENGQGLSSQQWRLLAEKAQLTTGDLVYGAQIQVRTAQKNVLATVQGMTQFNYDYETGRLHIGTDKHSYQAVDVSQAHSLDMQDRGGHEFGYR